LEAIGVHMREQRALVDSNDSISSGSYVGKSHTIGSGLAYGSARETMMMAMTFYTIGDREEGMWVFDSPETRTLLPESGCEFLGVAIIELY